VGGAQEVGEKKRLLKEPMRKTHKAPCIKTGKFGKREGGGSYSEDLYAAS